MMKTAANRWFQVPTRGVECNGAGWLRSALRPRLLLALVFALGLPAIDAGAVKDSPRSPSVVDLAAPIGDEVAMQSLDLEVGKSIFVRTGFAVKRVSVGDPEIVDVLALSTNEIQIVPKKIGETNMIVWERGGNPATIIDVAVGTSFTSLERRLRAVLRTDGINVESVGNAVVLTGSVPSPVLAERAVTVATAYFAQDQAEARTVVNVLEVGGNQQVMIEVVIAEMSRSLGRRLKVNWDTMIETGLKTFTFTNLLGDLISLDDDADSDNLLVRSGVDFIGTFVDPNDWNISYFVEAAVDKNLAKVLAKPTLLARSGQAASFLAGGEVPIPVAQGGAFGSVTVEFKTFGIGVEFTPTVLSPDRIHLEVAPEVSEPDFTLGAAVGGFSTPGFVTRRASTSVELGDGQSFAIAGLLKDNTGEIVEKYPLLGDIPYLGALFRSVEYRRQETELVMIVTPRLVRPLPEGPPPLPTDHFIDPTGFEFFLLGALESQRTGEPVPGASAGLIGPSGHRVPADTERSGE
jgi:pilus assembly protein CpaC